MATRLSVYWALSVLFLRQQVGERVYKYIARTVRESSRTIAEVEIIVWGEVFAVRQQNLVSVASAWFGWPDDWLQTRLRVTHGDVLRVSSAPHPKQSNPCTGITPVALTLPASQLERAVMAGWAKP